MTARFTEILARTPAGDVNLPGRRANLAIALIDQFRYFGITSALDTASGYLHDALDSITPHDPFRPMLLSILGSVYLETANGLAGRDERECLDVAIATLRGALSAAPERFPSRGLLVNNLAVALRRHPNRAVQAEAETYCRAWLATAEPAATGHQLVRSAVITALNDRLSTEYDPALLDEAEQLARALTTERPKDHRISIASQLALVHLLKIRADRFGVPAARAEAVTVVRAVVKAPMAPEDPVRAHATLGELLAGHDRSACRAYNAAVELLVRMVPRTWRQADREHGLSRFFALASDAAAAALAADEPHLAVELLERGRGILLGTAHADNTDLDRLHATHPDLARRFREVDLRIGALRTSPDSPATHAELLLRRSLEAEESEVLAEIRNEPGFERFFGGPSCAELLARLPGPAIIVNASKLRSDALVLADGELTVVPLPRLRHEHLVDQSAWFLQHRDRFVLGPALAAVEEATVDLRVRSLHNTRSWLWESVAAPVLAALGPRRRVWWCPTGLVALLPIHAAGRYRRSGEELPETVLDHVVPSYVPTLRTLLTPEAPPGNQRALAVGLGETPGHASLGAATDEAQAAAAALRDSTLLLDADATRSRLLAELPRHTWFHFAGHGRQDTYSTESACLLSYDHARSGGLTFADLRAARTSRAHLPYLSACQSSSGRLTLPGEAMHLAGAMLTAGFDRVVAANWQVSDRVAKNVAERFYRLVADPSPSAARSVEALQATVQHTPKKLARELTGADRDLAVLLWGAFVHFGR